jgi:signal peptidase I
MRLRRTRKIASILLLAACFTLAAVALLPGVLGYERYVITSGSMTGAYDRGSIVYANAVPTSDLRVGDVITYRPPRSTGRDTLLTHRIAWIGRDRRGERVFRTKGDANRVADPWRFRLEHSTQPRAAFGLPYAGYLLSALSIREVRMAAIGLPALLVALAVLGRLWIEAGVEQRRRAALGMSRAEAKEATG